MSLGLFPSLRVDWRFETQANVFLLRQRPSTIRLEPFPRCSSSDDPARLLYVHSQPELLGFVVTMPTEWFYQERGKTQGPLTPKELLEKVKVGEVTPQTLVKKDDSQWVEAAEVGGLTAAATKDRIYSCPFCDAVVMRPPTTCRGCTRWVEFSDNYRDPVEEAEAAEAKKGQKVVHKVANWVRSLMNEDD